MLISDFIQFLERLAPPSLQEHYDNCGLLIGQPNWTCKGVLISLDVTEQIIEEAIKENCNLIVAHHPMIFSGIKKINGQSAVEKQVIKAIKNDIAVYAIHTNLDNVIDGVNGRMAEEIGLENTRILLPKNNHLACLVTFCPKEHSSAVKEALFRGGAGAIGKYDECSFTSSGMGTFRAGDNANPFVGEMGVRHEEQEDRIEVILPLNRKAEVLKNLKEAHPYEEVAYYLYILENQFEEVGSGMIGTLSEPMSEKEFLKMLQVKFNAKSIKHSELLNRPIKNVCICGGSGSFLIKNALSAKADIFVTSDLKYHDFFLSEGQMILADIGHFESEQYTIDLIFDKLKEKFPTFVVRKTSFNTNPVNYL